MLNFNFIGVPINPTSDKNKPPKSQCLRNFSKAPKQKPNLRKNNKMFNLSSPKLLQPVTKNSQNKKNPRSPKCHQLLPKKSQKWKEDKSRISFRIF
ncbi:hypothetical protein CEXT_116811 [Caerostris extrusa]|uniref:Uncharacterized protein n=1 Tax=Caerostris extrusa TaxID=172846 RepID=A0AAV4PNU5_CAEEX|nr:hypothetical protein CEXT_116811 [Caerostris extrusa]